MPLEHLQHQDVPFTGCFSLLFTTSNRSYHIFCSLMAEVGSPQRLILINKLQVAGVWYLIYLAKSWYFTNLDFPETRGFSWISLPWPRLPFGGPRSFLGSLVFAEIYPFGAWIQDLGFRFHPINSQTSRKNTALPTTQNIVNICCLNDHHSPRPGRKTSHTWNHQVEDVMKKKSNTSFQWFIRLENKLVFNGTPQDPHSSQGLIIGGTAPIGPEIVKPTPRYITPGSNKGRKDSIFRYSGWFWLLSFASWLCLVSLE